MNFKQRLKTRQIWPTIQYQTRKNILRHMAPAAAWNYRVVTHDIYTNDWLVYRLLTTGKCPPAKKKTPKRYWHQVSMQCRRELNYLQLTVWHCLFTTVIVKDPLLLLLIDGPCVIVCCMELPIQSHSESFRKTKNSLVRRLRGRGPWCLDSYVMVADEKSVGWHWLRQHPYDEADGNLIEVNWVYAIMSQ
jgi:hypothetical protein